ncbi:DNA alkylation repair protein [Blastopirellula sp. JC732]|uniref:DNA alkylation repair protein n=1 Tax=Blastopirellula sediminis TaxID=2894196 RepID=A0A9X1SEL4_9BACT|nr:DNA alkylation repair protein [Blastopirellula sediminis]MCC9609253.1 DNA alkylation repair protein [Blastopirellula sediminis]MCC9627970.1 DNA alkylation repair protein [Blastopirellula sediminis]
MPRTIAELNARKPARRRSEVPADVLKAMNAGQIESRNLVEWLIIDQAKLLKAILPEIGVTDAAAQKSLLKAARELNEAGIMQRCTGIGAAFHAALGGGKEADVVYDKMAAHASDVVRIWGAFADAANPKFTFVQRLKRVRKFAIDSNAGVREIAWMAVRSPAPDALIDEVHRLQPWANDKHAYVRRFAIEVTRPCGVWCAHLKRLKEDPTPMIELLDACNSDETKYVQDSVANWLNDASKSQPDWVIKTCDRWQSESKTPQTARIVHRALRTLRKE